MYGFCKEVSFFVEYVDSLCVKCFCVSSKSSKAAACKFLTDVCCICVLLVPLELWLYLFVPLSSNYVLYIDVYSIYSGGIDFPPRDCLPLWNFCFVMISPTILPDFWKFSISHFADCFWVWDWVLGALSHESICLIGEILLSLLQWDASPNPFWYLVGVWIIQNLLQYLKPPMYKCIWIWFGWIVFFLLLR